MMTARELVVAIIRNTDREREERWWLRVALERGNLERAQRAMRNCDEYDDIIAGARDAIALWRAQERAGLGRASPGHADEAARGQTG